MRLCDHFHGMAWPLANLRLGCLIEMHQNGNNVDRYPKTLHQRNVAPHIPDISSKLGTMNVSVYCFNLRLLGVLGLAFNVANYYVLTDVALGIRCVCLHVYMYLYPTKEYAACQMETSTFGQISSRFCCSGVSLAICINPCSCHMGCFCRCEQWVHIIVQ